jgi:hypothetical protein
VASGCPIGAFPYCTTTHNCTYIDSSNILRVGISPSSGSNVGFRILVVLVFGGVAAMLWKMSTTPAAKPEQIDEGITFQYTVTTDDFDDWQKRLEHPEPQETMEYTPKEKSGVEELLPEGPRERPCDATCVL